MPDTVHNVLFLCTGNSARSILAESAMNRLGGGRFRGFSAGSHPKGTINPDALRLLERIGYPVDGLRSKSWEEFSGADAPHMHCVVTVCDDAAGEVCPIWPGHPMTAHWGIEDPSHVAGDDATRERAFARALGYIEARLTRLLALPFDALDPSGLRDAIRAIGRIEGASAFLTEKA